MTAQGVVTRARGRLARIQDETGGLAAFESSGAFRTAISNGEVRQGDLLRVTGRLTQFNGLLEIDTITSFEVLSRDHPLPEAQLVTLSELTGNGEAYESELIYLDNLTLVNQVQPAGSYSVRFDAGGLGSGLYFYRLQTASFIQTHKMLLAR